MWLAGAVVAAVRLGVGWSLGRRLVAEAAEGLARHQGDMSLDGLTTLSGAAALTPHTGALSLGGLTSFDAPDSIQLAKALATH